MMYNDELKHRISQDSNKISHSPLKRMVDSAGRTAFIPPRIKMYSTLYSAYPTNISTQTKNSFFLLVSQKSLKMEKQMIIQKIDRPVPD